MTRNENHVELTTLRASDAAQRARIAELEAEVERLKDALRATYPPPHSSNCGCRVCAIVQPRARTAELKAEVARPRGDVPHDKTVCPVCYGVGSNHNGPHP